MSRPVPVRPPARKSTTNRPGRLVSDFDEAIPLGRTALMRPSVSGPPSCYSFGGLGGSGSVTFLHPPFFEGAGAGAGSSGAGATSLGEGSTGAGLSPTSAFRHPPVGRSALGCCTGGNGFSADPTCGFGPRPPPVPSPTGRRRYTGRSSLLGDGSVLASEITVMLGSPLLSAGARYVGRWRNSDPVYRCAAEPVNAMLSRRSCP